MDLVNRLRDALADRYVPERELGSGGMATVYLARDLKHARSVALKVLRPELAASLGPERFLAEIRTTARLQHPHIVALFDSGQAAEFLYYVMPFIEGESLRDRLDREERLELRAMLTVARPVAEALAYAHELGVVHRDIKPENILLSRGQPFVTDFGIARAVTAAGGERLTATGLAVGTPAYMSPEQALGDEGIDARSDVYSLGCVIYEMLSGSPPFQGATAQALLARRLTGPPPRLATVPAPVEEVVRRSLATAPQDRFATAVSMADALVEAAQRPTMPELSIVILPFEDLSPEADNEYFSDGLTEEIIADLSMLDFLRVISRTSAMMFKGVKKSAPAIAQELQVRYVLEGSVRKAGHRLRITAQLIDAQTDRHIWAQKFDGVLEDVFDIQEEVAGKIVEALKGRLTPEDQKQMAARPSFHEVGIYETYARARFEFWRTEPGSQEKALSLLEEAVAAYGEHPLLLAGIGAAHWQFYHYLGDLDSRHLQVIESCAGKLIAEDPDSSAGSRLYSYLAMAAGKLDETIGHLQRAMHGDPNDTETLLWTAYVLASHAGRPSLAKPVADRWFAVDPLNPFVPAALLWVHWGDGDMEGGLHAADEWARRHPGNRICGFYRGLFLAYVGRDEEAQRQAEALVQEEPAEVMGQVLHFLTLALLGRRDEALGAVSSENQPHCWVDFGLPLWMADAYAVLGEVDEAVRWLERAVDNGMLNYPLLADLDPFLEDIRSEPRVQQLLAQTKERWDGLGREIGSDLRDLSFLSQ